MQICPNCAYNNRPGVVFCENCGTSLIGSQATAETKSLDKSADESASTSKVDVDTIKDAGVLGSEVFPPNATLRIEINDGSYVLKFNPQEKEIILFGRTDPSTGVTPQVDLTPYAGYRMGVSRRHAEIRRSTAQDNTLELWDLGSSNGTFLNGERLISHRPYVISDGDEIQLGQLRVRAFFFKDVTGTLDAAKLEPKPVEAPRPGGETIKVDAEAMKPLTSEPTLAEPPKEMPAVKPAVSPAEPPQSLPEAKPTESAVSPAAPPQSLPEVKPAESAASPAVPPQSLPEVKPAVSPAVPPKSESEAKPAASSTESPKTPEEKQPVSVPEVKKPEGEKTSDEKS